MTRDERKLLLRALSIAGDLVINRGNKDPMAVIYKYWLRLARAWNIDLKDASLSPQTPEARSELAELMAELNEAESYHN
jgi:hypothetical protein